MRNLRFAEVQDLKKAKRKKIRIFALLLIVVGTISFFFYLRTVFVVKHVQCALEMDACPADLQKRAESNLGNSMFSHLDGKRIWPNTLRVVFKKPEILLTFGTYSLAMDGTLVSFLQKSNNLPLIQDDMLATMKLGEKVSEKTLAFYQTLVSSLPNFSSLHIYSITVRKPDEIFIELERVHAIMRQSEVFSQLTALQSFMSSPTIDHMGKTIDLRFDNPVVK